MNRNDKEERNENSLSTGILVRVLPLRLRSLPEQREVITRAGWGTSSGADVDRSIDSIATAFRTGSQSGRLTEAASISSNNDP